MKDVGRQAELALKVKLDALTSAQSLALDELRKGLGEVKSMKKKVNEISESVDGLKTKVKDMKDRMRY